MSRLEKLFEHIITRQGDLNVSFDGLCALLTRLGFDERIRGDHHIFCKEGMEAIINLQPRAGLAKAYQVKQVRDLLLRHGLRLEE